VSSNANRAGAELFLDGQGLSAEFERSVRAITPIDGFEFWGRHKPRSKSTQLYQNAEEASNVLATYFR